MAIYDYHGNIIGTVKARPISAIFAENQLSAHQKNTISAVETAISNEYKIIEADVRFTSDSVPVLSHDASVNGYTIASYTYSALAALVPTLARLDEFLILCKKNNICAEIDFTKEYSTNQTQICYETVKKCGMIGRTMFTVYDSTARQLIGIDPDIIVCCSGVATTSAVDALSDIISAARMCICSTSYSSVTKELVEYMHNKGSYSKPWTVDSVATVNTLFGYGADFIITNSVKPSDL